MGSGALEIGDAVIHTPDEKPVSHIGDMAFVASFPFAGKSMHIVPALQDVNRLGAVFQNKINDRFELSKIPVPLDSLFLQISTKRWRELRFESYAHASAA